MKLTDISVIKELMERHGLRFQKQFGQNFLVNASVLLRITDEASENVLEIGPGIGSLTRELAQRAEKVVAVEIDRGLIPVLGETLADFPNITVVNGDIMKFDLPELIFEHFGSLPYSVCANLPYNITTPVLMKFCETERRPSSITVMIQKEVARRFTASPGSADYGAITASLAFYGHTERLFDVSAGNFIPAPKVDSTVIRIDMYEKPPVSVEDTPLLFAVIRAAFANRRKTFLNSLTSSFSHISKSELAVLLDEVNIPQSVRGECLTLTQYAAVADALHKRTVRR